MPGQDVLLIHLDVSKHLGARLLDVFQLLNYPKENQCQENKHALE